MTTFHSSGHGDSLGELVRSARRRLWMVSPYITREAMIRLLSTVKKLPADTRLITRLNEADLQSGSVDAAAISDMIRAGVAVRFADARLHAKLWVIDNLIAIGSANLTHGGLWRNHEVMLHDEPHENHAEQWFEDLWDRLAGSEQSLDVLDELAIRFRPTISARAEAKNGRDFGISIASSVSAWSKDASSNQGQQAWRLLGSGEMLLMPSAPLGDEYAQYRAGWAFPGSDGKRPRLAAGDRIYFVETIKLSHGKTDRRLVGRAIVDLPYTPGIGDSPAYLENELSPGGWSNVVRWPCVVWLRDVEIMGGTIADAPSTSNVIRETNAENPKIKVSPADDARMSAALESVFARYGVSRPTQPQMWWARYALYGQRYAFSDVVDRLPLSVSVAERDEFPIHLVGALAGRILRQGAALRVEALEDDGSYRLLGYYESVGKESTALRKIREIEGIFEAWRGAQIVDGSKVHAYWRARKLVPDFRKQPDALKSGCAVVEVDGIPIAHVYKLAGKSARWIDI